MTQVALKDLTLTQLLEALPYMVTPGNTLTYTYDVTFDETDERVTGKEFWIRIDGEVVTHGEGPSNDPEATSFQVIRGGVETILAMQTEGLRAATTLMILGYIFPSDIHKAEAWFKILQNGQASLAAALAKAGYEVTDSEIPLLAELSLG